MKSIISASIIALGLFAGAAQAAPQTFTDLADTAPRSVFDDIQDTAPKTVFEELNETAPRSDGVYGTLEKTAP